MRSRVEYLRAAGRHRLCGPQVSISENLIEPGGHRRRRAQRQRPTELAQACWALYAAITAVDILPASATCIPVERAHARIASDWPGGATLVAFAGRAFAFLAVVLLPATRFAFRLFWFVEALPEAGFLPAEDFEAAAFVPEAGSVTVTGVVALVATALRAVDFLACESFAAVVVPVALPEVAFPALARRLEPFGSLWLSNGLAVLVASGLACVALGPRARRFDGVRLAGGSALVVEFLPLASKASVTTASASANVS